MTAREPFWGLVQQRGPWHQTANDVRQARMKDVDWVGGGVPTGGRAHAGNGLWRSVINPDRQRTSFMPAPPPPSKYANPSIIDNNKPYPRGYLPDMPGFKDFQKVLDEKSDAIAQGLGITDHLPYAYPKAGALERDLDILTVTEGSNINSYATEDREALMDLRWEEAMDMMAAGTYISSSVKREVDIDGGVDNIVHLSGPSFNGRDEVNVFKPSPQQSLEEQAQYAVRDYKHVDDLEARIPGAFPATNPAGHLEELTYRQRKDSVSTASSHFASNAYSSESEYQELPRGRR